MFETPTIIFIYLKIPQSVTLLVESGDLRLSWSDSSMVNTTNTHEYLKGLSNIGTTRT